MKKAKKKPDKKSKVSKKKSKKIGLRYEDCYDVIDEEIAKKRYICYHNYMMKKVLSTISNFYNCKKVLSAQNTHLPMYWLYWYKKVFETLLNSINSYTIVTFVFSKILGILGRKLSPQQQFGDILIKCNLSIIL